MKSGVLFSGGKDSAYAAYLMKKKGHELSCLISIFSKNTESYMFHTPSISKVTTQAKVMDCPLLIKQTLGKKEDELIDLEKAIKKSVKDFNIEAIITGAILSEYQKSRIQNICDKLELKCINPLWKKDQFSLINELIKNDFHIIITGVFAYPFGKTWLGRKIDKDFIEDIKYLYDRYKINPAGEGGEYESFVINCPLFSRKIEIINKNIFGNKNSWRLEIDVK